MNDADFWQRCADANCVVLPVRAFREWGPMRGEGFIGLMFAAVEFDSEAAGPDFYFGLEEHVTGFDKLHPTPEAALQAYIAAHGGIVSIRPGEAARTLLVTLHNKSSVPLHVEVSPTVSGRAISVAAHDTRCDKDLP